MKDFYNAYVKEINGEPFYFVKHLLVFSEFKNVAPVLVGYGMHQSFEKSCAIAGIKDAELQKQIHRESRPIPTGRIISLKNYKFPNQKKSG